MNNLHQPAAQWKWPLALILAVLLLLFAGSARAEEPVQGTDSYCLSCHSNPNLSMKLASGEEVSLYVNPESLHQSVHSPLGIECVACHTDITSVPHSELTIQSKRDLTRALYQACTKCHSAIAEKTLDSMHAQVSADHPEAPVCTDCHGAHDVRPPDEPRSRISTTCSNCHGAIFAQYQKSVHGSALIQDNNPDVPVCTDCHGVHNIQDARTNQFRVQSPELCANCHANQELMNKYDLPANVYSLYQLSWHGVDVAVYKSRWPTIQHDSAVCTDCHGTHDILETQDPASSVNPANLLSTCQKCHPKAGKNWSGSWTGHNEIDIQRTPLLFYINLFYTSFVPFVLWVAGIYVALQILRATVNRVRRSLR